MSAAMAASRALSMPPSLEEIESYCRERGNQVDPEYFNNFREAMELLNMEEAKQL